MLITPHLHFDGRCEEALAFYGKTLGLKTTFLGRWGESPMAKDVPPDFAKKVMHASLELDGQELSAADSPPGWYRKPQGFTLALNVKTAAEADTVFAALGEGGKVDMPLAETFWAKRFGMLTDKYGQPWMVNCGKEKA
jgi:PhnB protein